MVAAFGPFAAIAARTLSLTATGGCAALIDRIGRPIAGPRAARFAAVLFVTYGFTRFLTAWASGFQDMLALLLTLLAVHSEQRGLRGRALVWAALAPFAKETAIVVFPLLALHTLLIEPGRERRPLRAAASFAGVMAGVIGLHLLVRTTWTGGGTNAQIVRAPMELLATVGVALREFVGGAPVLEPLSVALAMLAALAAALWIASLHGDAAGNTSQLDAAFVPRGSVPATLLSPGRRFLFLASAAALGLLPLVGGNLAGLSGTHAYYAFAAVPWLGLLLGLGLSRPRFAALGSMLVVGITGWNVMALGYQPPDMSTLSGWQFRRWDWREAVRLSEVSRRLSEDLKNQLTVRPESLVVCFAGIPVGTFFQTEDGPATRVALGDPTTRGYWLNSVPFGGQPGHVRLLELNPETLHLGPTRVGSGELGNYSGTSLAAGDAGTAWAFACIADSSRHAKFDLCYFGAGAALLAKGPAGYLRELHHVGLDDSTGEAPALRAAANAGDHPQLVAPLEAVLRHPATAAPHVAMADHFAAAKGWVSASVEWRIAMALEPCRPEERLRFATALFKVGNPPVARAELVKLEKDVRGTPLEATVRNGIVALDLAGAGMPQGPPHRVLGRPVEAEGSTAAPPEIPAPSRGSASAGR